MEWEATMRQRVPISENALIKPCYHGNGRLKDSMTFSIRDRIAMGMSVPGLQELPEIFVTSLTTSEVAVRKRLQHQGALLEDWLESTLKHASMPFDLTCAERTEAEMQDKGLQEYGLTRIQLLSMGLSQNEIERAYRMLFVHSVGCLDMLKELCIHCVQKSHLVGCFWRCYITLCEEHTKITLKTEVADLIKEKRQALEELKVTRSCLNEALDELSLESLRLLSMIESSKQEAAINETRRKEVTEAKEQLKEAKEQVEVMQITCAALDQKQQQTNLQVTSVRRPQADQWGWASNGALTLEECQHSFVGLERDHGGAA